MLGLKFFALFCFFSFLLVLIFGGDAPYITWERLNWAGKFLVIFSFLGIFASPIYLLEWLRESLVRTKEKEPCHFCSKRGFDKIIYISSDSRSNGSKICNICFDELILHERWNTINKNKWFSQKFK